MARLTAVVGKIPFEDNRISMDEFVALKPSLPLGSIPVAEIDGETYAQTNALVRYFGNLSGLYPKCALKALKVDQVIETVMDMQAALFSYRADEDGKVCKAQVDKKIKVDAPRYWGGCEKMLERYSSGPFVLGDQVSIADICISVIYLFLATGYLKFVPSNALDGYTRMHEVFKSVMAIPDVQKWYEAHPVRST